MTELKRCPFCGGEARISELTYPMKHYTVICSNENCYAEMGDFISNEDAIRMWNTRPNPWHTDTPTEEGWYLLHVRGTIPFRVAYMRNWQWLSTDDSRIRTDVVIEWQKIEENEDGRTD